MNRAKIVLATAALLLAVPCLVSCKNDNAASKTGATAAAYNHDMSVYKKLAEEALTLAKENKLAEAYPKTMELEKAWDKGTQDMHKADAKVWSEIDTQMDTAMEATNPSKSGTKEKAAAELQKFIDLLGKVPAK